MNAPCLRLFLLTPACLFLWLSGPLRADPIFKNSVVSNDIDFIRSDDPTTAFTILETGKDRKEMPDRRSDVLFLEGVNVFLIQYEDDSSVSVWAAPALGDSAARYVSLVAVALGKVPEELRRRLSHVVVHSGDEVAFGEEGGKFLVLYSKNMEKRLSEHDLEETIFHETVHAILEAEHAKSPGWILAQSRDPGFITEYAAKHPEKEDLPESALFAYTLTKFPGRLPKEIEQAIHQTMPNRLEYLQQLFESFDHPVNQIAGEKYLHCNPAGSGTTGPVE